jgi:hypothetical protein
VVESYEEARDNEGLRGADGIGLGVSAGSKCFVVLQHVSKSVIRSIRVWGELNLQWLGPVCPRPFFASFIYSLWVA